MLFLGNGLNIGWSARFEFQKKTSYLEEMKQCWFTIHILFRSYVDLRLCLLVIPKNSELFWLSSHLSCQVSVMTI